MNTKHSRLKQAVSLIAIGIFLMISLATTVYPFVDSSTNTTVAIKNCEAKPGVSGTLRVTVLALDSLDRPVPGVYVTIYAVHQKVRPDTCVFDVVLSVQNNFSTGLDGMATYVGPDWIHDNSKDLFRVEVNWGGSTNGIFPQPSRQVQAKFYSQSNFSFTAKQLPRI